MPCTSVTKRRFSLRSAIKRPIPAMNISVNIGSPTTVITCCRASRPWSPATMMSTAASAPWETPQKTRCRTGPASPSPVHSMSTTSAAESALVAKKIATMTTVSPCSRVVPGKFSKNSNIASGTLSATAAEISPPPPPMPSMLIADQPKVTNHSRVKKEGAKRTPRTNSRMVRPFEIRARKIPMKGAQLTVHAQ